MDLSLTSEIERLDLAVPRSERSTELGQDDFLTLMITQFQNQDPFKPMENGDFLGQMAQFSTVSGIEALDRSFADLASALYSNQTLEAAALVGRSVLTPTSEAPLAADGELHGAVELHEAATVVIDITDAGGALVQRIDLGAQPPGLVNFVWDGRTAGDEPAPEGVYGISARAGGDNGHAVPTLALDVVESVHLAPGGGSLELELSQLGLRSLNDVRRIS